MNIINHLVIAGTVGFASGLHTSIWGMYKDAAHEGFSRLRFARSIVVGSLCAITLQLLLDLPLANPGSLVLLFGLAYAMERGIVEVWKTFFRDEDQSKYFIPMQFSVRGEPVGDRRLRMIAGVAYSIGVALCLRGIATFDHGGATSRLTSALVGLTVGLVIAIGGGWKDAPKEGFDPLKFLRSPAMTVFYTLLLSLITDSYLLMAVAAIGFERATVETYKKFCFPSTPPGKFAGKPVTHPEMFQRRRAFVPIYAAIWVAVIATGALALREPTVRLLAWATP